MGKVLGSGAEAIVRIDSNYVVKERVSKGYRHESIDFAIRTSRTKREIKILKSLESFGFVPKLLGFDSNKISMELIEGDQVKKLLDKKPQLALMIGKNLAVMHDNNIMHGDLTTSNMILCKSKDKLKNNRLYFIDFGLSFVSARIEDKAVDIHLFKQSLESKHYKVFDKAYKYFLKGYMPENKKEILARLDVVESRGKYKEKT